MSKIRICDDGGEGMFFSQVGDGTKPNVLWSLIFFLLMVYLFMGTAIIADIFMSSIEACTSWKRRKINPDTGRAVTENVWHETVATLTLMALGSSAPEIFLAVIETFKDGMHAGDLGASTIVGSAAFNLFMIVAICVAVIPKMEVRCIDNMKAFVVTGIFSIFAYGWMVFVLVFHGKDVIDEVEGLATFFFLPCLVWISYSVEDGMLKSCFERFYPPEEEQPLPEESSHRVGFATDEIFVPGTTQRQTIAVAVMRKGGLKSKVRCTYRSESLSAVAGYDFEPAVGTVEFHTGSAEETICIELLPKAVDSVGRAFLLVLESADGMCDFDPNGDGGQNDSAILTLRIEPCKSMSTSSVARTFDACFNRNQISLACNDWREQFINSFYCNGSPEEQAEASKMDWCIHIISFPWKLCFSIVPPTSFCGGWLCFFFAIAGIGIITAVISDTAEMFGCLLDIPDIVTATVFVALGTSMPDLFASLSAAVGDPTADASIVNVTGSNSVNVFLGLGIPWTASAFYWQKNGRDAEWEARYPDIASDAQYAGRAVFVVKSQNLGFSVLVFTGLCTMALLLLVLRRKYLGAELGGPIVPKFASAFLLAWLWIAYVTLTSWRVLRCEGAAEGDWCKASLVEQVIVCGGVFCLTILIGLPSLISIKRYAQEAKNEDLQRKSQKTSRDSDSSTDEEGRKESFGGLAIIPEQPESQCTASERSMPLEPRSPGLGPKPPDLEKANGYIRQIPSEWDTEDATPNNPKERTVVNFMKLKTGVGHIRTNSFCTIGANTLTALPSNRIKSGNLVAVIVAAYHSSGKNESVFEIKPVMPLQKLVQVWCKQNNIQEKDAVFKLRGREIQPSDTVASLGHDPSKGPMVLRAFPRRNKTANGVAEKH